MGKSIAVIIVSYGHDKILPELLGKLNEQKKPQDLLLVVDNHASRKAGLIAKRTKYVDFVLELDNGGFASGCNQGAELVKNQADILLFLNPDTKPSKNLLKVIREQQGDYALTMPLVLLPNGRVNSAGNVVHISGLSWCAGYDDNVSKYRRIREIDVVSGAGLAISKDWWAKLGGFAEGYFMYYEDTDLCSRAKLMGAEMALLPDASIEHDYDFIKGNHKWLYLERNRALYILRCWPWQIIITLLPIIFISEIGLWLISLLQRRFLLRVKSQLKLINKLPWALKSRKSIQKSRKISVEEFYSSLEYKLDSPLLGRVGSNKLFMACYRSYYKAVNYLLRAA